MTRTQPSPRPVEKIVMGLIVSALVGLVGVAECRAQGTFPPPLLAHIDTPAPADDSPYLVMSADPWDQIIGGWAFNCQTGDAIGDNAGEVYPNGQTGRDGITDASSHEPGTSSALVLVDGRPRAMFWAHGLYRPDVARHHAPWCQALPPARSGFLGQFYDPLPPGVYSIAVQLADEAGAWHWQARVEVR